MITYCDVAICTSNHDFEIQLSQGAQFLKKKKKKGTGLKTIDIQKGFVLKITSCAYILA